MPKQYRFTCLFLNLDEWDHIVLLCGFELLVNLYVSVGNFYCCLVFHCVNVTVSVLLLMGILLFQFGDTKDNAISSLKPRYYCTCVRGLFLRIHALESRENC